MTMTIALIALAHGLPVYFLGLLTRSRTVLTIAAVVAILIAIGTGAASYLIFDLIAIGVAYYLCYSSIGPARVVDAPRNEPVSAAQPKEPSALNSLLGGVVLIVAGVVIYNKIVDKPSPPPSVSVRLAAYGSDLRNEKFDNRFPLVDTQIQDNTLHVAFRSTDQTAADVTKRFAKIDFARAYSTYYCSSRVSGPLLIEGAKIVVSLSGKDAKQVGRYEITKNNCDALVATHPTSGKGSSTAGVKVPPALAPAAPTFDVISRCFFVYAPIFQVGRDRPHTELFQFGQPRVAWVGGYVQANRDNPTFKRVFEANLDANKRAGIKIEETLVQALNTGERGRFSWAINEAISCDKLVGIRTDFLPRL